MLGFKFDGDINRKTADKVRELFHLRMGEMLDLRTDPICSRFSSAITYKRFKLTRVEFDPRPSSVNGSKDLVITFTYKKQPKIKQGCRKRGKIPF